MAEIDDCNVPDVPGIWLIQNAEVTQMKFDFSITLVFSTDVELRISQPFHLIGPQGTSFLDPEEDAVLLSPCLEMTRARVTSVAVSPTGTLTLGFANSLILEVEASPDFEAWEWTAPGGVLAVCRPGGELTTWSGVPEP
jgi:hypothetical protein